MSDIWREGKYIDMWSLIHFMSGMVLGGFVIPFDLPFIISLILVLIILISWEIFEIIVKVNETIYNRIVDVIIGLLGFFLIVYFKEVYLSVLLILFPIFVFLNISGFVAYKKRERGRHN